MIARLFGRSDGTNCQKMDPALQEVVIVSALRTPLGSFRWNFKNLKAKDLAGQVIKEALDRCSMKPEKVQEVFLGNVLQANQGQNVARQSTLAAGLPDTVPAVTINKVCSSGLKAISLAAQGLMLNQQHCVVAGGTESMSNCPFYLERGEIKYGGQQIIDGILRDGLTDASSEMHMGLCAEKTATDYGITREMQDTYAIDSYKRAADAWKSGVFREEVMTVEVAQKGAPPMKIFEDDDYKKLNEEKLKSLSPAFKKDGTGTITAANASSLNDAAAVCVLMTGKRAQDMGKNPLAKILGFADAAVAPVDFTIAPVHSMKKVLDQCGLKPEDIDLWEINEAFSVTPLACMKEMGLDHSKVNVHGGAVAFGHPIGVSGARLVVHLAHALKKGQKGMVGICNGGGESSAMLIEKL